MIAHRFTEIEKKEYRKLNSGYKIVGNILTLTFFVFGLSLFVYLILSEDFNVFHVSKKRED